MPCDGVLNQTATIRVNNELILKAEPNELAVLKEAIAEAVSVKAGEVNMTIRGQYSVSFTWGRSTVTVNADRLTVRPDYYEDEIAAAVKGFTTILVRKQTLDALKAAGAKVTEKPKVKNNVWSVRVEV